MRAALPALVVLAAALTAQLAVASQQPSISPRTSAAIVGVVLDETGGALTSARVELFDEKGKLFETAPVDGAGSFRFDAVAGSLYQVRVQCEGFRTVTIRVQATGRTFAPLTITMPLAGVTQEIIVRGNDALVSAASAANADALSIDTSALQALPVFDTDVLRTVSQFLDAGATAGGATLVVNGMEVNSLAVSASAIQQIKVNSDPYSAEYSRPGRGRIEILTKPGGQSIRGEVNEIARNAAFDARNAFADTKPGERRQILEGSIGGPIGRGGRRSFLISGQADRDDQEVFILAEGAAGPIRDRAPVANRHALVSGSLTLQPSDRTTIALRPSYEYTRNPNRGVGGTTLASAGWAYVHTEDNLSYLQQTILGPGLINQLQVLAGDENEPTISASDATAIVVDGAFRGGGAQNTLLRIERHVQASESLTWTRGHHLIQGGVQIPDWSWRRFDDRTNSGGTFYFANLEAYKAATPYAFAQQLGNGRLTWLEKVIGIYAKDDWRASERLTLSIGLRYDWANYFNDNNNVAPRASLAYSLRPGDVIRVGGGVFYDKIGPTPVLAVLQSEPDRVRRVILTDPAYPDAAAGGALASAPTSVTRFAPDIQIPRTFQYSASLEHQVVKGTTLAITYTGSRASIFRSRDVNAPLAPLTATFANRPDPAFGQIRQIESSAAQHTDNLQVTLRGVLTRWFNGQAQYTLGHSTSNSDGVSDFPSNDYDLSSEWGRASFDRRHRVVLLGRLTGLRVVDLGLNLNLQSGAPYTEWLPGDPFKNGRGSARPSGVARNTLTGAGQATLDLRASREIALGQKTAHHASLAISLDAFNVLNHINYSSYVGTLGSPLFGRPVSARPPRQMQLSARLAF